MSDDKTEVAENNPGRDGNKVFQGDLPKGNFGQPNMTGGGMKSKLFQEIPFELIGLPSKGVIYEEGHALSGAESIEIKAMGPTEEDILTSPALIKKGTVITELLKSCLIDKSIDPGDMIAGDRNAIMTAVRAVGYGSSYGPVEVECSECNYKDKEHHFMLNKLPFKPLTIEPVKPFSNLFSFTLPKAGFSVLFKFLTGHEEEMISKTKANKKKMLGQIIENNVTEQLLNTIVQIEDVTDRAEISMYITRYMNAQDSKSLRKFMDENEPGIVMKQNHDCPACNHSEEVNIPIGVNFFWPE